MAVGFSGSNGGIGGGQTLNTLFSLQNAPRKTVVELKLPREVSYFINNECQLDCKHCYVGIKRADRALSLDEWKRVFADAITLGARTFGNVGKEPTLSWDKTLGLLQWFQEQKAVQLSGDLPLRYGLVTNGIALTGQKIAQLAEADPTYVDVSFDGNEERHDYIRGRGMYRRTFDNLMGFPDRLKEKVFVSFTLNAINDGSLGELVDALYGIGMRNFLVSPYVSTEVGPNQNWPRLVIRDSACAEYAQRLLAGGRINWQKYSGLRVFFKTDHVTSGGVAEQLLSQGMIRKNNLCIDRYGTIFDQHDLGSDNVVYFNYIPFDDTLIRSVRISHDGYVGGCYAMFADDETYHHLASGNVRGVSLREILSVV